MKKLLMAVLCYSLAVVVILPLLVTLLLGGFSRELPQEARLLYGLEDLKTINRELEDYVVGVVAAEMPASFPEEALKAQAVAARTYQLRQMRAANSKKILFDVGQAYCTEAEQKKKWGEAYETYHRKIQEAVLATAGEIMVYEGEPILAAFHAQSAGKTEDAANVWAASVPYLKSVDSSGDKEAPEHETKVIFSQEELFARLGVKGTEIAIRSHTPAGYVAEVQVGERVFQGGELREALGLRSACFRVAQTAEGIVFTVYGYGHGAGMSQYGASALAKQGKEYHEILQHYYQGIHFAKLE